MQMSAFAPLQLPLLIAASLLPVAVSANEPMAMTTVVVEATPEVTTPIGIDVANLPSLRAAASDTASLLRDVPGMSVYGAGGVSSLPVLHGLGDDRLRIKVDGMDLISACGNHMNPALSYIDPSNVDSIQVFSGIAPVSVSGDSIGGAILVKSPEPAFAAAGQDTLLKGQAGAFYRSNGNAVGGNFSATIASETLSMTYSGSTVKSGNYTAGGDFKPAGPAAAGRGWLAADAVGSSGYQSTNQSLGLALRHENHLVELKLGMQDIPYQGFPNQRMDMTGNDSTQINLRYKGQYEWGALEARAYEEKTRHKMQFGDDKQFWYGTAPGMPMDTEGENTGALIKADIVLSARDLLRVGGEIQQYRLNDWWPPSGSGGMSPNTFWNIKDGERDRYAVFGEWEARWSPQWLSQFGVRSETVKMDTGSVQGYNGSYAADAQAFNGADRNRTDRNRDLTALARYTPDAARTFEFGYARKTRSPNLYERYSWSTGGMAMRMVNMAGDGNGYVGNLDLAPEVAHTLSATADWHDARRKKWGLKVTPYYTYIQDYIDARRCISASANCGAANQTAATGFVYLQFANQSARLYGLDVSAHYPLAESSAYGSFTATGMLNYVNGENRTTGDNLYNIMPLNAKLAVVQRLGNWTHTVEAQWADAKTDVSRVRNEVETAGYGLLNLRSSYAWKQARFDVGIENVFDRFYNHPLGGAYVGQGKTMSGTDVAWGTPVPGMGRSIYTGVTVKF
ncbi:MAG: TonB-dependent receptor [Hydrogenophilales bacterium 17-61-9]|nr:MAG: TonB-dependent receptor [Hydrogenophilales bacterium 17-61-9]